MFCFVVVCSSLCVVVLVFVVVCYVVVCVRARVVYWCCVMLLVVRWLCFVVGCCKKLSLCVVRCLSFVA